jgi:hypothetical protein
MERSVHADYHALWIDPRDPEHLVLGGDGGLALSYDRGATWEHLRNLPIAQYYGIVLDQARPYRIYGGLQDNGSWVGPSATHRNDGIAASDWTRLLGMDGFQCQVDPANPDTVYLEGQFGLLHRTSLHTGNDVPIRPRSPKGVPAYRYNWNTPLLLSRHAPRTVYYGANCLLRSVDAGEHWEAISPDLSRSPPGPRPDMGHTISAIAESPLKQGLLYAGTDDGRLHVSRDAGVHWTEIGGHLPGVAPEGTVSRIECSHFGEGTAYVALDRHRQDDCRPYLFKTTDHGQGWRPLASDLPQEAPVYVVREDLRNPELLFAGTERGLLVSLDGGRRWQRFGQGLPAVPIFDLAIHPMERELVVGTHGRSLYIIDISPLQELSPRALLEDFHLFDIKPTVAYQPRLGPGSDGAKELKGANPPYGAPIWYYIRKPGIGDRQIIIRNKSGQTIARLKAVEQAGVHQVIWSLEDDSKDDPPTLVPPGEYRVALQVDGRAQEKRLTVVPEPPGQP